MQCTVYQKYSKRDAEDNGAGDDHIPGPFEVRKFIRSGVQNGNAGGDYLDFTKHMQSDAQDSGQGSAAVCSEPLHSVVSGGERPIAS